MEKWAAIDIGSNTVQLLVAESESFHFRPPVQRSDDGNQILESAANYRRQNLFFALRTTCLGANPKPGLLTTAGVDATLAVLKEYRTLLVKQGVEMVRVIATSAVRDAINRDILLTAVQQQCGWQVEVLSGQEEAYLSFLGASDRALTNGVRHILLLDIGGSSSELIRWRDGCLHAISADVGALRAQVAGWQADDIEKTLIRVIKTQADDKAALVLGVGGTITTAAALMQGCQEYNRESVEGYYLKAEAVNKLLEELRPLSVKQRCDFSPLLKKRGLIICEGLLILSIFLRLLLLPGLQVSAGGVLNGSLIDLSLRKLSPANKV